MLWSMVPQCLIYWQSQSLFLLTPVIVTRNSGPFRSVMESFTSRRGGSIMPTIRSGTVFFHFLGSKYASTNVWLHRDTRSASSDMLISTAVYFSLISSCHGITFLMPKLCDYVHQMIHGALCMYTVTVAFNIQRRHHLAIGIKGIFSNTAMLL